MNSKKRILVTTTTFPSFLKNDSTPPFVYELSKRLIKKNDLEIIVSTPYVKNSKEYEERDNLKIHRYKYGFTALRAGAILPNIKKNKLLIFQVPLFFLFSFLSLVKLIKKEKIDIIHAHWIIPQGFLAVLYKRLFRKKDLKIICTVHGGDIFSLRDWFFTKIKKWTLDNVDEITVVSKEIKREVEKIFVIPTKANEVRVSGVEESANMLYLLLKNNFRNLFYLLTDPSARSYRRSVGMTKIRKGLTNLKIAPMGVDEKIFSPDEYDKNIKKKYNITGPFLLFVGRLVEKKGIKYAIAAMPIVLKKHPDVKFIIVGKGPLENELKKQVKKLNLENSIIFAGGVLNNKLPRYYATADIFLGPSITAKNGDSEGFGLTFAEALLCKCCVISSDLKAISDIIKNEKTGIQVDVKSMELFAEKIIELIEDENKRKKLAGDGYEFVKNRFTWDISAERYYDLIKDL
ncbi:MAG: glycosyltransferase [Xanthomonadaceae bacterium]|nr:glycosyltransferase [Rhodospirillaceae bacterium]NIA17626.1 glycosyltransferase [Xanthomonadaceae bacterium]